MILKEMRTLFLAQSSIADLVQDIHINRAAQGAELDYLLLTQISGDFNPRLDGTGGLVFSDIDADAKASTYLKAQAIADAVKTYFQDFSGTAGAVTIGAVILNNERHDYEFPKAKGDQGNHVVSLDFQVQWYP